MPGPPVLPYFTASPFLAPLSAYHTVTHMGCNQPFPSGSGNCAFSDAPLQACYGPVNEGLQVACFQVFHFWCVALDWSYSKWRGVLLGRRLGWNGVPTKFRIHRFYGMVQPIQSIVAHLSGLSLGIHPACLSMPVRSVSGHPSGPPQHIHPVHSGTGVLIILQTYWLLCLQDSLSGLTGDSQYFKLGGVL